MSCDGVNVVSDAFPVGIEQSPTGNFLFGPTF